MDNNIYHEEYLSISHSLDNSSPSPLHLPLNEIMIEEKIEKIIANNCK